MKEARVWPLTCGAEGRAPLPLCSIVAPTKWNLRNARVQVMTTCVFLQVTWSLAYLLKPVLKFSNTHFC